MPTEESKKIAFASVEWIDAARSVLKDLVATHGKCGQDFSCSETFTGAPREISASGTAAWHFRIEGNSVNVGVGPLADADLRVTADYATTLPIARLVFTREILAKLATEPPVGPVPDVQGDRSKAPSYLTELHNKLAIITA